MDSGFTGFSRKEKRSHFVFIEFLIATLVIGVLGTFSIMFVSTIPAKARDARRVSDMRNIIDGLQQELLNHGRVPCSGFISSTDPTFLGELVRDGYLSSNPRDPGSLAYEYRSFAAAPGASCGEVAYIGFTAERPLSKCPGNGVVVDQTHCHIIYPHPLSCSDPNFSHLQLPEDCEALGDTANQ